MIVNGKIVKNLSLSPHLSLTFSLPQIEDLSQQVHKAAADKFKVPLEPSPLIPESTPSLSIKEESEEEEEEVFPLSYNQWIKPLKHVSHRLFSLCSPCSL